MASKYVKVKCECGNEQVVFDHATTQVKCSKCKVVLVHPQGGKSLIHGEILEEVG